MRTSSLDVPSLSRDDARQFTACTGERMSGNKWPHDRRGAMLVLVAVTMIACISLMALALDGGAVQRQRRLTQKAADAGATAAAIEIFRNRIDSVQASALSGAKRNGFENGVNGVTVTVTYPTISGFFVGGKYVKVEVTKRIGTTFASFIGQDSATIRSQAIGGMAPSNICLAVLDTTGTSLSVKSGTLTTNNCGIAVNSTSANAVETPSNGDISASSLSVAGGPSTKPNGITGDYSPASPQIPDPLGYLAMPPVGPCNGAYGAYQNYAGATLSPGVYCGGIGIDHSTVTFNPGLYILAGGGLLLKHATVRGTGVTFVNTNAPVANGGASNYAPFDFDVNTDAQFHAMTTGSLAGILFYQDRAAGLPNVSYTNFIGSSSAVTYDGTVYIPTQAVSTKSNSALTINGGLVVGSVKITTGQAILAINGAAGGQFFIPKRATIVE